jgi:hypothetical protein
MVAVGPAGKLVASQSPEDRERLRERVSVDAA